jgi:predicted dehydrogenase
MGYDLKLDPDMHVLTHARAFQRHPEFRLVGGVDSAHQQRDVFEAHYGVPSYADVESAMDALQPDVVAIATPTALHGSTVRAVLRTGRPLAILCEKPLSFEIDEARDLVDLCAKKECRLFANYMRRSDRGVVEVKRRLSEGLIDLPAKGVVWYSKGLFNNGSHFLNLLQYWLGDVTGFRVIEPGRLWDGIDPEPDLTLSFLHGTVFFLAAHEEDFSHYTAELVAPNGRLRYEQGGEKILWQGTVKDAACDGYTILDASEEIIETNFSRVQWHVADQLAACVQGRQAQLCSGTEALQTLETLAAIRSTL